MLIFEKLQYFTNQTWTLILGTQLLAPVCRTQRTPLFEALMYNFEKNNIP